MKNKTIKFVGLLIVMLLVASFQAACGGKATATPSGGGEAGEASGKPGPAIDLTGDPTAGATIYTSECEKCHGPEGKGGVENPGATEPTVPPLNPIDPALKSPDAKTFATNLDIFIEHGSTPEGNNPAKVMAAYGDEGKLKPQQIADVIAYIISLNK